MTPLALAALLVAAPGPHPRHVLEVQLDPAGRRLRVQDTVTLTPSGAPRDVEFLLNGALAIDSASPPVAERPLGDVGSFFGINGAAPELAGKVPLRRFRVRLPSGADSFHLAYSGRFDFALGEQKEEYARGFRETVGQVGPDGVYLAGQSMWYPHLGTDLVEFRLDAEAPAGWHLLSQGRGQSRDALGFARWESDGPMDEIYLVGGPLEVWRDAAGAVETLVYLREKDDALAAKYLAATARYLEMYGALIGAYPYAKFALVENFWETGYGMPSFTLLGPKVIRFPFILHSSYPHEILHNWWGNSVFVDYPRGNWCEGLTAYLADHLIQEQRGKGDEHRRAALQKYRDFVRDGRDFPLVEFRVRDSAATEAVGYGKTMMVFHMLRSSLGDEAFKRLLRVLYRDGRGRRAGFADLRRAAEEAAGRDLAAFFEQWTGRPGAPDLRLVEASVRREEAGFALALTLAQVQPGAPFSLEVPVAIVAEDATRLETVRLDSARQTFTLALPARPLAVHVDPRFDLFRRLDPRETPPSLGQIFGEPAVLALLPAAASAAEQEALRALVESWKTASHSIEMRLDRDVETLPVDRAVWLLGRDNRHAGLLAGASGPYRISGGTLAVAGESMPLAGGSAALVARHPEAADKAVGWIFGEPLDALAALGRKLPHYGKYSYVGVAGAAADNVLKGQLAVADSPLSADLRPPAERDRPLPALRLPARPALAELPPAFSRRALAGHVAFLAAPEREGRGLGSPGLDAARDYIAAAFARAGLAPAGANGGFLQLFRAPGPGGRDVEAANVAGWIPGSDPARRDECVVVSAHYDHLGRGWPDVHAGDEGLVHPGADDNASGVAVLIELARELAAAERPKRSIAFLAFSAEESGRRGSAAWIAAPTPCAPDRLYAAVNLDTVGRLGTGPVQILGSATAEEWPHIFRGGSFVTGVESRTIPAPLDSSDQATFVARGVPAVQVFTGPHADYHRPGDSADKVDVGGLVKVAALVREAVSYLGERAGPLTRPGAGPAAPAAGATAGARRVSFGSVPDFAWSGPGVRLAGVTPGSPAERAGLRAGDILTALDGRTLASLAEFSQALKTMAPGQAVRATIERAGAREEVTVTLIER